MAMRGRPYTYEEVVADLRDNGALEWHKVFVVRAKSSIGGKSIRGFCYKKTIARPVDYGRANAFGAYSLQIVYATHKEAFQDKLRNSNES